MAKLGEMLLEEGLLTEEQLQQALAAQKKKHDFLGSILIRNGYLTEKALVDILVRQTGSPTVDLESVDLPTALTKTVPWDLARKHHCVPVKETGKILHVAMVEPKNSMAIDDIAMRTNRVIKTFLTGPISLEKAWMKLYGDEAARDGDLLAKGVDRLKMSMNKKVEMGRMALVSKDYAQQRSEEERDDEPTITEIDDFDSIVTGALDDVQIVDQTKDDDESLYGLSIAAEAAPIINLVNGILIKAVQMGASDIHIEPFEKQFRVRFRIDGTLHLVMSLPTSVKKSVTSRLKIMSDLDIAERRLPQDGRVKVSIGRKEIDFRVNCLPTVFGEKVVMRILGQSNLHAGVKELGFEETALENTEWALKSPYGMILVTGPTGSGKSTTLYTMLSQLNTMDRNIVTAEDPVEYNLHGIVQVPVRPAIGFSFDTALRAFLRQDPDIIMVGEMRDYETASIGCKAALTGHLVLSTLHTNDAPSTVTRMVDMGIEPFLCAAATKLVVAQRLVRRICPDCVADAELTDEVRLTLHSLGMSDDEIDTFSAKKGAGCDTCNQIGYKGRAPVFEVMAINSRELKEVIMKGGTHVEIARVAKKMGMQTLSDAAISHARNAITTIEESLKIAVAED